MIENGKDRTAPKMTDASHDAFVEQAYDDACTLLVAVRDYLSGPADADGRALAPAARMRLTYELSRITRRLTEATAWLMLQKAVAAGELGRDEAARAAAGRLALETEADEIAEDGTLAELPLAARGLIDRTRRLWARVCQIESSLGAGEA